MFGGSSFGKSVVPSPTASTSGNLSGVNNPNNPNNDFEVPEVSADGISTLSFSPVSDHFVATSWDCSVKLWEATPQRGFFGGASQSSVQCAPKAMQSHSEPVLCSAFSRDGRAVFFGGTDGQVKLWDLGSNQVRQVAQHEHGVKECAFIEQHGFLLTGSWDKKLCYWDCRAATPAHTIALPDRINAMDVKGNILVVATSYRHIQSYDLRSPLKPKGTQESPLKWQTRCVACFTDEKGYFVGSIEGRCAVQHHDVVNASKNFTFKCHRQGDNKSSQDIYAVNAIKVHPTYGTFVTCGSDGMFAFWDKESKRRLQPMKRCNDSISCAAFSRDGALFAYAVSYDWRYGVEGYNPDTMRSRVFLHQVQESEVRPGGTLASQRKK